MSYDFIPNISYAPIRCYTCSKPIGHLFKNYLNEKNMNPQQLLDSLGLNRWCCRMMFVGYSPVNDMLLKYSRN